MAGSFTSGDLIVDRRADYAEMLAGSGEPAAAAELMADALERVPGWAAGWFRLGEWRLASGDADSAKDAFRRCLALDEADRLGAALMLERLGLGRAAAPTGFVEALFDQYADRFEAALVDRLAYRVPDLLESALFAENGLSADTALDLGCGTGLMGVRLRPHVRMLAGIDLSAAMLRKAGEKGIYDRLSRGDLLTDPLGEGFDLVVAADVMMYVGPLPAAVGRIAACLRPGGLLAFSVEDAGGEGEVVLGETRRYAHGERHVRASLAEAGFAAVTIAAHEIRHDRGAPVAGLVVTARRP